MTLFLIELLPRLQISDISFLHYGPNTPLCLSEASFLPCANTNTSAQLAQVDLEVAEEGSALSCGGGCFLKLSGLSKITGK